jgi:hypothetical protein
MTVRGRASRGTLTGRRGLIAGAPPEVWSGTTDDQTEGAENLFFTPARVMAAIAALGITPGQILVADANGLPVGDAGIFVASAFDVTPTSNEALALGPAVDLYLKAPDAGGRPQGVDLFANTRTGNGSELGLQALLNNSGVGLFLYDSYSDNDNLKGLRINSEIIAIYNLAAGQMVDTQLLITGEGAFGVALTDEAVGAGWATGFGGKNDWLPVSEYGVSGNHNALDIGAPDNAPKSIYAATSIVTPLVESAEISTPDAPADGSLRLYAKGAGGGKTGLYVLFPSGAEQQIKVEA